MAIVSNLYAEKIFAEQPNSLWAFDEKFGFISLISEANKNTNNWLTPTNATVVAAVPGTDPVSPIQSAYYTKLKANAATTQAIFSSPTGAFASTATDFSIGFYLYAYAGSNITSVTISYKNSGTETTYPVQIPTTAIASWNYFSANFYSTVSSGQILIKINYSSASSNTADFIVSGVSVGNNSEEFQMTTTGDNPVSLPSTLSTVISDTYGFEAVNFGTKKLSGYYIVSGSNCLARNSSMPMVYGAANTTVLSPHPTPGKPSLIIPGIGFMNKVNESTTMTFEAWFKIKNESSVIRKIFGPVSSTDGLYVNGPFLILKIGSRIGSYHVGEWFRPMLIQIVVGRQGASLILNGTQVISIPINAGTLSFPAKTNSGGTVDYDWLGFYSYTDVPSVEVDCVAIYPYAVSEVLASRRFVYGQGAEFKNNINIAYSGETTFIDYSFANYANNYNYPQIGKWSNGIQENISSEGGYLSVPNYNLPNIYTSLLDQTTLMKDIYTKNNSSSEPDSFYTMVPSSSWNGNAAYIEFPTLNLLTSKVAGIFGIFKTEASLPSSEQTLIKIFNRSTGDYVKISLGSSGIMHKVKIGSMSETNIVSAQTIATNTIFKAGLVFSSLQTLTIADFKAFFGNPDNLSIYVAGESKTSNSTTFTGYIYQVGFCNDRNLQKISGQFGSSGNISTPAVTTYSSDAICSHYPSYGLVCNIIVDNAYLDIKSNSYWEDNIPLSLLSRSVQKSDGSSAYSLNCIQYNIGYPEPKMTSSSTYDTTASLLKSYVTFQYTSDGANKPASNFTTMVAAPTNKEITPGSSWATEKYEVTNNSVIYPPTSLDNGKTVSDLSLVSSIEMFVDGIIINPLKIKTLQLAGQAYDELVGSSSAPINPIGTRFGVNLYPYTEDSSKPFSDKNSIIINKQVEQYLTLSASSGIRLSGSTSSQKRGIKIPLISKNISSFQFSMLWTEDSFPASLTELGKFSNGATLYIQRLSGNPNKGVITISSAYPAKFYINGNLSSLPVVMKKEWVSVVASLTGNTISYSNDLSNLNNNFMWKSSAMFNNFSYYEFPLSKTSQIINYNYWNTNIASLGSWASVATAKPTWINVLIASSQNIPSITSDKLYQSMLGTRKTIIDSDKYSGNIRLHNSSYAIYVGKSSQSQLYTAT